MNDEIVIFGYGPVGRAAAELLSAQGRALRIAQRKAPASLPKGASFVACDTMDRDAVRAAARGASQVVLAIGLPYESALWREAWPRVMNHFVDVCAEIGARLIFVDNLYMYGPQTLPLVETMALTAYGAKPAARAAATQVWMAASQAGRARVAALRAPDFYGPGVDNAHLGAQSFGALAKGGAATLIVPPDMPHDFAYVPDFARAVVTLIDAPDDCYGQAWHVPCAPTRTPREILAMGAKALGMKPRARMLPFWAQAPLGLFTPFLREMREMRFQWDRPYRVDCGKFARRFWSDATPFETGAKETALAFAAAAKTG